MKRLPFSYKDTLRPWFNEKDMEKGWELLAEGLLATLFFRNFGGGLFKGGTTQGKAILGFSKSSGKIRNFQIDQCYCTCCSRKQLRGNYCHHLAAVAISLLLESGEAERLEPLLFLFERSLWSDIATCLHDENENKTLSVECHDIEDTF